MQFTLAMGSQKCCLLPTFPFAVEAGSCWPTGHLGKPSFWRQLLVHLGIKPASTATRKPSMLRSNQAPPAAKPWPGTKSHQWTMRLGPRLRQPLATLCHLQWGLFTSTLLKGMFLYHLKPRCGLSSLTFKGPGDEIGFKWIIKGCWAVGTSSVLERCPPHPLLSSGLGEGPASVLSWGACAPVMNLGRGCVCNVPLQGALEGPGEAPCRWGALYCLPWSWGSSLRQTPLAATYVLPGVPPPWGFQCPEENMPRLSTCPRNTFLRVLPRRKTSWFGSVLLPAFCKQP